MNLDYTDEQQAIKAEIGKFLSQRCGLSEVRRVLEGNEADYHRELWRALSELGWLSAAIPAEFGGLGLDRVVLCAVAEELGRALAPVPVSSSIFLAAEAVMALGSVDQKQVLLPGLGSGKTIGTFALWEGPGSLQPRIEARVESGRLHGSKSPVPDGLIADVAIVGARAESSDDIGLFVVQLDQPEVRRERMNGIDPTRPVGRLVFNSARAEPLGNSTGWNAIQRVLERAAVLCAFEQVGAGEKALEQAVAYAHARHAFGRPIGGFQVIKHKLADVFIQLELARSNAYYAAWALNTGSDQLPIAAAIARVSATRAFELAARELVHVHGGFGMTWESDCHVFYRRSRQLALGLGGVNDWRDRLIGLLERGTA
jgi:acyl-CoA dehydrogenase